MQTWDIQHDIQPTSDEGTGWSKHASQHASHCSPVLGSRDHPSVSQLGSEKDYASRIHGLGKGGADFLFFFDEAHTHTLGLSPPTGRKRSFVKPRASQANR